MPRILGTLNSSLRSYYLVNRRIRWDIRQLSTHRDGGWHNDVFVEAIVNDNPAQEMTEYDEQFRLTPEDAMTLARVIHDAAVRAMALSTTAYGPGDYPWEDEPNDGMEPPEPEYGYDEPGDLPF